MTHFYELGIKEPILSTLQKMGFQNPSEIQEKAIPLVLEGKDVIGLAKTGSGKTAACAIPVCQIVDSSLHEIQALIIVPTRELALQYVMETHEIGKERGVVSFAIYGGEDPDIQHSKLRHGVDILVATPGRLIDFIYNHHIQLDKIKVLILDEADKMLSMGFYDDLSFIMSCLVQDHQTLLFSATMPKEIREIAQRHMKAPVEISPSHKETAPEKIEHFFAYCRHPERNQVFLEILKQYKPHQSIIFCEARHQCEKLTKLLKGEFQGVDFIHGGLNQDIRTSITNKFRQGKIKHLVATDVASRGLDFSGVTHVFIYEMSEDPETYIHRSGRTGRWEQEGTVVSLVTKRDLRTVNQIMKIIGREPRWIGKPPMPLHEGHEQRRRSYPSKNKPSSS